MKKTGYQQFFKKAREVRRETPAPSVRRPSAPKMDSEEKIRRALRMKPAKRPPFPMKALAGLALSLFLAGVYIADPNVLNQIASHVDIQAFGQAEAASSTPAQSSNSTPASAANPAAGQAQTNAAPNVDSNKPVSTELSQFENLRQRKEQLDQREKELAALEAELQKQKVELDKKIAELQDLRGQISDILKNRVELDQQKVDKLVDLYSNMKPQQAAAVIATINEDLAVQILAKMKKKNAAAIMNLLPAEKAKVLSEKYTGYLIAPDSKG